eukprot:RCo016898
MSSGEQAVFPQSVSTAPLRRANSSPTHGSVLRCGSRRKCGKCGIPLFVSLIVPALLVAVVFMVVLWQTTLLSASQSVDYVSGRILDVVHLHLLGQVSLLTREMAATAQMSVAAALVDYNETSLQHYFYHTMELIKDVGAITFISTTGAGFGILRSASDMLFLAMYDPAKNGTRINGSEPLLQVWRVNSRLEKLSLVYTIPYDTLSRPWYIAAVSHNFSAAFSPVFQCLVPCYEGRSLGLGIPVRSPTGGVLGVLAVNYILKTIQEALDTAHQALHTTGMLVLLAEDGSLIASSVRSNSTEIQATIEALPMLSFPSSGDVMLTSLAPFGRSFVLRMTVPGQVRPDFFAYGLNWRLFVVLPQADYYAGVWANNRVAAILVGVCIVTFLVMQLFFYRFILVFHLRTLLHGLVELRAAVDNCNEPDEGGVFTVRDPRKLSVFSEIRALHEVTCGGGLCRGHLLRGSGGPTAGSGAGPGRGAGPGADALEGDVLRDGEPRDADAVDDVHWDGRDPLGDDNARPEAAGVHPVHQLQRERSALPNQRPAGLLENSERDARSGRSSLCPS